MKVIEGYVNYSVGEDGTIYGPQGPLKPNKNSRGYANVSLVSWVDGVRKVKSFSVHRLVAKAYCAQRPGANIVNHIDFNQMNNHPSNLEWVTSSENDLHAAAFGRKKSGKDHYKYKDGKGATAEARALRRQQIATQYKSHQIQIG